MSLCVVVTTADGLVMGADSTTYVRDSALEKTYFNATKLFELAGMPIAVITYGLGGLGRRSIGSLVDEWSERHANYGADYTVEQVARDLTDWVFARHQKYREDVEKALEEQRVLRLAQQQSVDEAGGQVPPDEGEVPEFTDWTTGIIVGGYQSSSVFPYLYVREDPPRPGSRAGLHEQRPHEFHDDQDEGPEAGIDSWGSDEALHRLMKGYAPALIGELGLDDESFRETAAKHVWAVIHEGMPAQDAVDYAKFLLQVGSGFERFKAGQPLVGGESDIAVITRSGVHWHSVKPLTDALNKKVRMARGCVAPMRDTD